MSRRTFLRKTVAGIAFGGASLVTGSSVLPPVKGATSSVEPASYIIYKQGSTVYAQNGTTGVIDYSGTDASTVLNNAMSALSPGGGNVFVRVGTYTINSSLNIPSGISLVGESTSDSGTILIAGNSNINVVNVTGSYWIISNLKISGGALVGTRCVRLASGNGRMVNVRCTDGAYGVYVEGADYWQIINCLLGNHSVAGVYFKDHGVNVLITECVFDSLNAGAIFLDYPTAQEAQGVIISNNVILSNGYGIKILQAYTSHIVNNIIDQCTLAAIFLGDSLVQDVSIDRNYVASARGTTNSSIGIDSGGALGVSVVGNRIEANYSQGVRFRAGGSVYAQRVLFQGNTLNNNNRGNTGAGEADFDSVQYLRVLNNYCISSATVNSYAEISSVQKPTGLVLGNMFAKGAVYLGGTTDVYNSSTA